MANDDLLQAIRTALEAAWDEGNAMGLDGWVGPERGTQPDEHAIRQRERKIAGQVDSLRAGYVGKLVGYSEGLRLAMRTLQNTLDGMYSAAGLPDEVDDFDYLLDVVTQLRRKAQHQPVEVWSERAGEMSWRCLCGGVSKHVPLPRFVTQSGVFLCPDEVLVAEQRQRMLAGEAARDV